MTLLKEILSTSATRAFLSILMGFLVGAVFMMVSGQDVAKAWEAGGFAEAFGAAIQTVTDGYGALFRGSVFNARADDLATALRPLTETLRLAGPLIAAGLGISLGFRVGLFNIGGNGQMLFGIIWATWISTRVELPIVLHMLVAMVVAILGASLWGALVGFLKAQTGAHEVILTIMLNYVAISLFTWFIRSPNLLQAEQAGGTPKADAPALSAQLPALFPGTYALHLGFVLAILATVTYWWLMERSVIGYRFRMVGHNPHAARTAGISVGRTYVMAMAVSAAFVGVAGANQALGTPVGYTETIHSGIGFDGITVALLGGGNAWGIFFAGLLFGAFKAGGPQMQVTGISPEVLGIVQGAIVLFIAAPPLVRAMFRLPSLSSTPSLDRLRSRFSKKGVGA
ncbi:MAG: ABC transporter permease [Microbacteriaceae bacterium BACL25 MAG-120322-bin65]|jgi:general nucleoside transport system permease protein|nr:MAG: ABC transporter permease [Microbacteriaceae bacterium BACL25 MAG-120322-bin65]